MNNFLLKILNKLTLIEVKETVFYNSIKNTPIDKFWDIQKGDLFSLVKEKGTVFPSTDKIEQAYYELMDSYYEHFKRSQEKINEIKNKHKYAKLLSKYIKNPNSNNKMFMQIAKQSISEDILTNKEPEEKALGEYISHLEYNYNFQIKEEECSTYRFYNYLKTLKTQHNQNNQK